MRRHEGTWRRPCGSRGEGFRARLVSLRGIVLAAGIVPALLLSPPPASADQASGSATDGARTSAASGATRRYTPDRFAGRAWKHYQLVWGIDSLNVRLTESGEVVRFSYRVLDPEKARALNDGSTEPSLVDPKAGVSLVVPALEKVGRLRQVSKPEAGKAYWMAFSNKGRPVKKGDRVDVIIGAFRAQGLVVD